VQQPIQTKNIGMNFGSHKGDNFNMNSFIKEEVDFPEMP